MSDSRDASGQMPRRVPRNQQAQVSGGLAIVLAAVAVIAGFLILRSIAGGDGVVDGPAVAQPAVETTTTLDAGVAPTTIPATTTTIAGMVTDGASVVVANANAVNGSAGLMSSELGAVGYQMGTPTNASASIGKIDLTVVYFDPGIPSAQAVAESVARSLGGVSSIAPLPTPAPTQTGSLDGSGVPVMPGVAKAGRTLAELAPALPPAQHAAC